MSIPNRYLRTESAAEYVGRSKSNMEKLRCNGKGPAFIKHGGIVIYDINDLDSWLAERKTFHTHGLSEAISAQRERAAGCNQTALTKS